MALCIYPLKGFLNAIQFQQAAVLGRGDAAAADSRFAVTLARPSLPLPFSLALPLGR